MKEFIGYLVSIVILCYFLKDIGHPGIEVLIGAGMISLAIHHKKG